MSLQTIARRYAIALADVVLEQNEAAAVQEELNQWTEMVESNPLLKEAVSNPTVAYEQKRKVLQELIQRTRVRDTTANFLQVLLRNQRLNEIKEVNKWFGLILDERSGMVSAEVTTARPVGQDSIDALRQKLANLTGRKVRLKFTTDPDLIGGMVARIGSTVYDGSIKNQLHEMELTMAGS
ncbi:MAG TPA: ATP synthase F1 subunit delta [Pyrinomonadaceae bacterium]|nr:ATP synthase F1 subunit delta [Pyrinomonadaceae bacterium]